MGKYNFICPECNGIMQLIGSDCYPEAYSVECPDVECSQNDIEITLKTAKMKIKLVKCKYTNTPQKPDFCRNRCPYRLDCSDLREYLDGN
jgi:hypothetical protein